MNVGNVESWQAGLFLGAAFTLLVDFGVRALLWRLRIRKKTQCEHCTGILGEDDRAEFPVEKLECCAWCGDTWELEKRPPGYEPPVVGYRDSARDQIQELLRGLPPAPKKGDLVDLDAAFNRLSRPVPGSGKQRYGSGLQYGGGNAPPGVFSAPKPELPLPRPPKQVLR